jgi:hypothetical protein
MACTVHTYSLSGSSKINSKSSPCGHRQTITRDSHLRKPAQSTVTSSQPSYCLQWFNQYHVRAVFDSWRTLPDFEAWKKVHLSSLPSQQKLFQEIHPHSCQEVSQTFQSQTKPAPPLQKQKTRNTNYESNDSDPN